MIKSMTRVHRRPGTTHEEFERYWTTVHAPLVAPTIPGLRKYVLNVAFKPEDSDVEPDWDGVAELGFDDLKSMRAGMSAPTWMTDERQKSSERLLDMATLLGMTAEEHVILDTPPEPGRRYVKLLAFVHRNPSMTHDEFADYWVNTHAPLVKPRIPGLRRYILNVAFQPPDSDTPPPCDGVVELCFDDLPSLRKGMSAPDWMADERQRSSEAFLDLGRNTSLTTMEHVVPLPTSR
jgi:uncharacterized protein (TIGR02118 family)